MAEQLCKLKKKGGGGSLSETVLWTNSAPTSSFTSQVVSLSDNFDNYDYVKIYGKVSTSLSTEISAIFTPESIKNSHIVGTYTGGAQICILAGYGNSNLRYIRYITNTSGNRNEIAFSNAIQVGSSDANTYVIPTKIIGLK